MGRYGQVLNMATNLILVLLTIPLAKILDLENEERNLLYVRITYGSVQALIIFLCFYIAAKIKEKNDITELSYVEPAKPFPVSKEPPKMIETTIRDYDLDKNKEVLNQTFTSLALIMFLHFYLGLNQPLLAQSILPLKNIYQQQIVQIHLLGKEVKRPFKTVSLFDLTDSSNQTDKVAFKKKKQ
ncbi:9990_t:CDS:2 [Diversispora eburnea]|uniref:9990_t:CDS:1 n=1 Tax=Diversispora eburnea TaxID=1213867 RepID=A0A9N8Z7I9_9GLOM|nr:9990_t:CDS:2 [Diversispora eburnea]